MHWISNFYLFQAVPDVAQLEADLHRMRSRDLNALLIIAAEGINGTFTSTDKSQVEDYEKLLQQHFGAEIIFKRSSSKIRPLTDFVVKIRPEIVTLGSPDLTPQGRHRHLSPEEWNQTLKTEKDLLLVDTRNWYEYEIGTFKGAINPGIEQFTEFPDYAEKNFPKNQKMLIFCTGGIRCEKGLLELEKRGFQNVHQLEGGILSYLEKFPNDEFVGECFVFDQRVAVKQDLSPTETYKFCPHCGQPGAQRITCVRCDHSAQICERCSQIEVQRETCSKNCAHHHRQQPGVKGRHQSRSPQQAV